MCGIAGIVSRGLSGDSDLVAVEKMAEIIRHRGPDDHGTRQGIHYALSHRRLSIIDLEGGHQPMSNEDGTIWLVYNGEIYNFQEIREQLLQKGHQFRTGSDTEVIIHLYEDHGTECVSRLNGMFAFALFDEKKKLLFMARDRAGIKPLYYSFNGGSLRFASEAKALVQTSPMLIGPDLRSIVDFFALSLVQEGRTAFEGIRELRPAHRLVWEFGKQPHLERYWRPVYAEKSSLSRPQLTEAVSSLLDDAVHSHLISDVPVGTYLSGGLDSSLVSAMASRYMPGGINTFSAGFVGRESVDERVYAREVAEYIGSNHHEVEVGPDDFMNNLTHIIWHMDEPTLSPGVYPYYFLCELVSRSVKVVLGGQGADDLFGGYPRYRKALLEDGLKKAFSHGRYIRLASGLREYRRRYGLGGLKNELLRLNAPDERRIYEIVSGFHPRRVPQLFSPEFKKKVSDYNPLEVFYESLSECDSDNLIDRMLYNDFHNMLASILRTEDRMSMAHSIESRVPLLDYRLVELAASIPVEEKVRADEPKLILKSVGKGRVPESVISRSKQGFSAPMDSWLTGPLAEEAREFLLGDRAMARGYFSKSYNEKLFSRCIEQKKDIWRIWSLITFEMWNRVFLDGEVR